MDKQWYQSKTLWFNVITVILGVFSVVNKSFPLDPQMLVWINGAGNVILRVISGQPISFGSKSLGKKN